MQKSSILAVVVLIGCTSLLAGCGDSQYKAKQEVVEDFGALVPESGEVTAGAAPVTLERVSTAVPWPRGMVMTDKGLVVLARGRHRRAGGVDPNIEDHAGSLFVVDPSISEPVVAGELAGEAVRNNGTVLARPTSPPFFLYDGRDNPVTDLKMDRPYCTLAYDPVSQNFFICGYSGVDQPGAKFRKNATDSIHRYDLRNASWHVVEFHDALVVPEDELGYVVSNEHYPHHDPAKNPPPHGWLNGGDSGTVAGEYLYFAAKDNHRVVRYDLAPIRQDPDAGPPASEPVLGDRVTVRHPGGEKSIRVMGPSALAVRDGFLYVGYRTSSVILRFKLNEDGALAEPKVGTLIAVFEPWDAEKGRGANLIDIAFDSKGELFISCAKEGRIWNAGVPDPDRPFYGNDQTDRPTDAPPYVDLPAVLGKKAGCGNITFDAQDRLYICSGTNDTESETLKGVIYRVIPAR